MFARVRLGRLVSRALSWALVVALSALVASCTRIRYLGGLMVVFKTDGSISPDWIDISINTISGEVLRNYPRRIPEECTLPTSIAIVSNGDPTASVAITAKVWKGNHEVLLDSRTVRVFEIPVDRVAELDIVFGGACTGVMCPDGTTCDPSTGSCLSNVSVGMILPTFPPDAGIPDASCSPTTPPECIGSSVGSCVDGIWQVVDCTLGCHGGLCDVCSSGSAQCAGNAVQKCGSEGQWATPGAACSGSLPVCLDGACIQCSPTSARCAGNVSQTCDSNGSWGAPVDCGPDATCVTGKCSVSGCGPNQARCSPDSTSSQICGPDGQWEAAAPCAEGTTCVAGSCTGVCVPGTSSCDGNTAEKCDATGQWQYTPCSAATFCAYGECALSPPSCAASGAGLPMVAGLSDCPSGSCCASSLVTGGTSDRTYTSDEGMVTGVADPVTVSDFRLDKYDVTVGRFRVFVAAWNGGAGWTPPAGSGKHTHLNGGQGLADSADPGAFEPGWVASDDAYITPTDANLGSLPHCTWTPIAAAGERLPINCVNWYEAYAFCIWDSGFLPSEAEWEYAAAGGAEQLEYPWGSTPPGTMNQYAIYGCYYPKNTGMCGPTGGNIAPVGTAALGVGLAGELDLVGEVFQWDLDTEGDYVDPCVDCGSFATSLHRAYRGGYWGGGSPSDLSALSPSSRNFDPATDRNIANGFRCARAP